MIKCHDPKKLTKEFISANCSMSQSIAEKFKGGTQIWQKPGGGNWLKKQWRNAAYCLTAHEFPRLYFHAIQDHLPSGGKGHSEMILRYYLSIKKLHHTLVYMWILRGISAIESSSSQLTLAWVKLTKKKQKTKTQKKTQYNKTKQNKKKPEQYNQLIFLNE